MSAPTVSPGRTFVRFVLVTIIGGALLLGWFAVSQRRNTHPKPTHPGNPRPATTARPHPHPTHK